MTPLQVVPEGPGKVSLEYTSPVEPYRRRLEVHFVENHDTGRIEIQLVTPHKDDLGFIGIVRKVR